MYAIRSYYGVVFRFGVGGYHTLDRITSYNVCYTKLLRNRKHDEKNIELDGIAGLLNGQKITIEPKDLKRNGTRREKEHE